MIYEQLKLENQICFPLYAASRLIIRAYQEDLEKLNITYTQYLVLMVLWEKENLTVNEIAEKLILNTNTVTPLLKRMEYSELITRLPAANDQRKVMIKLTQQGKELQLLASEIPKNLLSKLKININDDEILEAIELKNKLNSLINRLEKKTI